MRVPIRAPVRAFALALSLACLAPAAHADCGGSFDAFVAGVAAEAQAKGIDAATVRGFLAGARLNPAILKLDRGQGTFRKSFLDFLADRVSKARIANGRAAIARNQAVFNEIQRRYGIPPGVIAGYWGLETDYGAVQGKFLVRDSLLTLAHDCRRPDLFRPHLFAAMELYQRGNFDPNRTIGAWAGEIGQFQMLPEDVLTNGTDGDGDGHVDVVRSSSDALMSAAKMLAGFGWRPNEPWLQEIVVPDSLDWTQTGLNHQLPVSQWAAMGVRARSGDLSTGLPGSVLLPMGRKGPAFLAYPNYRIYFNWNKSFVYATTAAYFATRLDGAPALDPRSPEKGLSADEVKVLQTKLRAKGHDVGKIDGILGELTREAVQTEQERAGLPADGWPTKALLAAL